MSQLSFISYKQLCVDVAAWADQLPDDIIAIAGIPRSGMLPAAQLALRRNLHLVQLDQLQQGQTPWMEPLRRRVGAKRRGRVLVVDDSCNSGKTLRIIRHTMRQAAAPLLFGALYTKRTNVDGLDLYGRQVPVPRIFEWNLFHSKQTMKTCFDFDGVFCHDPPFQEQDDEAGRAAMLRHVRNARPRFIPTFPTLAVVSSRLERYRQPTEDWLQRHGISYSQLVLSPHDTAQERRKFRDGATRKAEFYKQCAAATLFVESSVKQAQQIATLSGKPVICVDTMQLF